MSMLTLDGADFSEEFSGSIESISMDEQRQRYETLLDNTAKPTSTEQAVAGSPQTTLPQVLQWCLRKE